MEQPDRPLDVVVHGATGFVGRLVAEHLAHHASQLRIGLSGRSLQRLEAVRDGLGPAAAGWELHVVDAADDVGLAALADRARVVVSTVGPYARHGLPLVRACAEHGTHYADLSGEVLFIRESSLRYHEVARRTGARIVHAAGFDSVPSDLGVLLTAERARADGAGQLRETTLTVRDLAGGLSGGTVDSMRLQLMAARDPGARRVLADPYALSPDRDAEPDLDQQAPSRAFQDAATGTWVAPFPMAGINTRVVHRSNALLGWRYGRSFRYREVVALGRGSRARRRAQALALGLDAAVVALALPGARQLADRLLPSPGEGPDEETRRTGHFRMEVLARTASGQQYGTTVEADGDPGYAATAVMLGQTAVALAAGTGLPGGGGVLTPATALGAVLADRLVAAGFRIATERVSAPR
ncbi:saccharopine dehydrogenase family protein [Georgenia sunbinii]|uniref:saccharopine dehydrogenase family protein n=1 Tax=Georgenia sunbinii TaxID=3117728 RepID=UPI002F267C0C